MRSTVPLLLVCVLASLLVASNAGSDKLRIGIKKRVENCELRSKKGDRLSMHYTVSKPHPQAHLCYCLSPQGTLEDGTEFDSSIPRKQPFVFTLGVGQVIKGQ